MLIQYGFSPAPPDWPKSVVCIGTFDGVHLGHQAVMRTAAAKAASLGLPAGMVTFDRNPLELIAPERSPLPLASWRQNLEFAHSVGIQFTLLLSFNEELRNLTAEEFLQVGLIGSVNACHVVVGADFAMGKGRQGTADWLSRRIESSIVQPVFVDGSRVSSTAIRTSLLEGDAETAARLLGRDFLLEGVVVKGQQLGRELGFPTANLAMLHKGIIPADGVYAAEAETPIGLFPAAVSIGSRPTVGDLPRAVEAYLLDYPGRDLYGTVVKLWFKKRIRGQEKYEGMEALTSQIAQDVTEVKRILADAR